MNPINPLETTPSNTAPFDAFVGALEREILAPILTLIALAAFLLFVWGIVEFIRGADNEEKRRTGQQHMVWGIIGLVIIFGANAIVALIKTTLGQ